MFGLSLAKILLIVVAAAALWYGFRLVQRRNRARSVERPPAEPPPAVETLVKCATCGAYNPPGVACTHRA